MESRIEVGAGLIYDQVLMDGVLVVDIFYLLTKVAIKSTSLSPDACRSASYSRF